MKEIPTNRFTFIFYIILTLLSIFWIALIIINNRIFTKVVILFVIAILVLLVAISSIYNRLIDVKYSLKLKQEKEKNIRDFYRYQQLVDPPDFDIYN